MLEINDYLIQVKNDDDSFTWGCDKCSWSGQPWSLTLLMDHMKKCYFEEWYIMMIAEKATLRGRILTLTQDGWLWEIAPNLGV